MLLHSLSLMLILLRRHRTAVPHLVFRFVPYTKKDPLPCFCVLNHVLPVPYLAKLSHKHLRIIERLHGLNEMEFSIGLRLVDAEGHPNSDGDSEEERRENYRTV